MDVVLFSATVVLSIGFEKVLLSLSSSLGKQYNDGNDDDHHRRRLLLRCALENKTSLNAAEKICLVSADNVPTATGGLRADMRLHNLWHRATYVLIVHRPVQIEHHENIVHHPTTAAASETRGGGGDGDGDGDGGYCYHHLDDGSDTAVFVQKRSYGKDYCPGKLDPTPGGVVGFGESYRENAVRELEEEMGIKVAASASACATTQTRQSSSSSSSQQQSPPSAACSSSTSVHDTAATTAATATAADLQRLFTFSYQSDSVKVWGEFYECVYTGTMKDLILQEEEVDSIHRMSLADLKDRIDDRPDDFMPDAAHAMKLYFQRRQDVFANRRLLKGYSSGDLDSYGLRPKPAVVFFDCDDCLYFNGWKTARQLTAKIDEWCVRRGLRPGQAYELYKQYGTALRGLLAEGYLEKTDDAIDGYLAAVHDVPVSDSIGTDARLRSMILRMDPSVPRFIFTASVKEHAARCLRALGVDDLFDGIIDCKACDLETKHSRYAFYAAMKEAAAALSTKLSVDIMNNPERCLFVDDSPANIRAARDVGWRSVLVGRVGRDCGTTVSSEHAEVEIDRIHDLPAALPELFQT